jgi:hypothetical protein
MVAAEEVGWDKGGTQLAGGYKLVRFLALAASMNMTAFWNTAYCSLVEVGRFTMMMDESPLKRRSTFTRLLGAISQKDVILNCMFLYGNGNANDHLGAGFSGPQLLKEILLLRLT